MKYNKRNRFQYVILSFFFLLFYSTEMFSSGFVSAMKGIGSGFESFGKTIGSGDFWHSIGMGFGAAPTGYVYSYAVINNTPLTMYVNRQDMASFMGAVFPKATGFNQSELKPFEQSYKVENQDYYFEMYITANKQEPTNRLPYVQSALYVQDCIQLATEKNSKKMNYFHIYMGKDIKDGHYVHTPKAEFVGYANPSDSKDKGASITISDVLTGDPALTIYNSTHDDIVVGYSSKKQVKSLSKDDCDIFFTDMLKSSFIIRSPTTDAGSSQQSLPLGTLGIFSKNETKSSEIFAMPVTCFGGKKYTLEIYQDVGGDRLICIQALMSEHDVPSCRVRDVTPVTVVFWYESVAQLQKSDAKNMIDLPGQVWIVSKGERDTIQSQVSLGSAVQFSLLRPNIEEKRWIYFLYIDIKSDDPKGKQFVDNFIAGKNGADLVKKYEQQGINQFNQIQKDLSNILTFKANAKGAKEQDKSSDKIVVPESLLVAALQGALQVDGGQIKDAALDINGYLLGGDLFLSQGVGASSTLYYQLSPSQKTATSVPTGSVVNGYTMGISSAPKGMPAPIKI